MWNEPCYLWWIWSWRDRQCPHVYEFGQLCYGLLSSWFIKESLGVGWDQVVVNVSLQNDMILPNLKDEVVHHVLERSSSHQTMLDNFFPSLTFTFWGRWLKMYLAHSFKVPWTKPIIWNILNPICPLLQSHQINLMWTGSLW